MLIKAIFMPNKVNTMYKTDPYFQKLQSHLINFHFILKIRFVLGTADFLLSCPLFVFLTIRP
jgi:hypothetical protein